MSYREPAPRPLRLWYVALAYAGPETNHHHCKFYWAREADDALELAMETVIGQGKNKHRTDAWHWMVVCGEDFAEREAKGPPKAAT